MKYGRLFKNGLSLDLTLAVQCGAIGASAAAPAAAAEEKVIERINKENFIHSLKEEEIKQDLSRKSLFSFSNLLRIIIIHPLKHIFFRPHHRSERAGEKEPAD